MLSLLLFSPYRLASPHKHTHTGLNAAIAAAAPTPGAATTAASPKKRGGGGGGGRRRPPKPLNSGLFWNADHIVPVVEGGGLQGALPWSL